MFFLVLLCLPLFVGEGKEPPRVTIPDGVATVGTDRGELVDQLANSGAKIIWYSDETPEKKVKVKAFIIDAFEVTNKRFSKFNPKKLYPENLANHPAVNIMWDEADEFCKSIGGRLPTEAEWERAARGDDGTVYPWGDKFDPAKVVYLGNIKEDSKLKIGSFDRETSGENLLGGTSPAGSNEKGKSQFGLYDMAGNVWEWVDGWYDKEKKLRILKGGSWLSPKASVRSGARIADGGTGVFNDYGFRCAYDIGE